MTDEFLRDVTRLAREAWREGHPINGYVAASMLDAGKVGHLASDETVHGWRKAASKRRTKHPEDDSFLLAGELRGKPQSPSPNDDEDETE